MGSTQSKRSQRIDEILDRGQKKFWDNHIHDLRKACAETPRTLEADPPGESPTPRKKQGVSA